MNTNLHPQLQKCHNKFNQKSLPLFDYSETIYKSRIKLNIMCLKCNTPFMQRFDKHMEGQQGNCLCRPTNIRKEKARIKKEHPTTKYIKSDKRDLDVVITSAEKVNNNIDDYDYSGVGLTKIKTVFYIMNIRCNRCNNIFNQKKFEHLNGRGCQKCNSGHMHSIEEYRLKKTILYYVKIDNVYKIGISQSSIKKRFSGDKNIELSIIDSWVFADGADAYLIEQTIIKKFKHKKYNNLMYGNILVGGNSELFYEDIIKDIRPIINALHVI